MIEELAQDFKPGFHIGMFAYYFMRVSTSSCVCFRFRYVVVIRLVRMFMCLWSLSFKSMYYLGFGWIVEHRTQIEFEIQSHDYD